MITRRAGIPDKPDLIVIDHRGAGIGVEQDLRKAGYCHLYAASKDGASNDSKIYRFGRALLYMYDGVVKYPVSAPFLDDVLYALATFPGLSSLISLTVSHNLSLTRRTR